MSDIISRRRNAVFGHIARLDTTVPAHQALHAHVNLSLGRNPDPTWKRRPGRPRCRWIDQIRKDSNDTPPADLWRREMGRGHGASLRPKLATRWTTTTNVVCTILYDMVGCRTFVCRIRSSAWVSCGCFVPLVWSKFFIKATLFECCSGLSFRLSRSVASHVTVDFQSQTRGKVLKTWCTNTQRLF